MEGLGERDDGLLPGQVSDVSGHKVETNFGTFPMLSPESDSADTHKCV